MVYETPVFRPMGDRAVLVELSDKISAIVNDRVRDLLLALDLHPIDGVLDLVPAYSSLLVVYNPLKTDLNAIEDRVLKLINHKEIQGALPARRVTVPVAYGRDFGPDLEWVADFHGISPEELIHLHTGATYRVYMIGFMPGFAYMGDLPEQLATPRKETPRTRVPAGSVAIAQRQTGIYPAESPGGWQIIGRTPIPLFNPHTWPPAALAMGDMIQFHPISPEAFLNWRP